MVEGVFIMHVELERIVIIKMYDIWIHFFYKLKIKFISVASNPILI